MTTKTKTPCKSKAGELLTERETAELLRVRPSTLAVWRCTRRYPLSWIRVGRSIRYRLADVEAFIEDRTETPVTV